MKIKNFKSIISVRFALYGLLIILSSLVVFHILILAGVIPSGITWGGRMPREELVKIEIVTIILSLVMVSVVAIRLGLLKIKIRDEVLRIVFWLMFAQFVLNTFGNIFSVNRFEKLVFTPATVLLAVFALRVALEKKSIPGNPSSM